MEAQDEIPAAKAAVDEEWEKLEKIPAWDLTVAILAQAILLKLVVTQ